jgi:hypothetical protein
MWLKQYYELGRLSRAAKLLRYYCELDVRPSRFSDGRLAITANE